MWLNIILAIFISFFSIILIIAFCEVVGKIEIYSYSKCSNCGARNTEAEVLSTIAEFTCKDCGKEWVVPL